MRGGWGWLAVAGLWMAGLASGTGAQTTEPFAGVAGVTLVPYAVAGRTPAAIRRSMDALRPTDPNDGTRVDALSRYQLHWRWRDDGHGQCAIADDDVGFTATVTVPRLADPAVPAGVRARFDRFLVSLMAHEEGHVRYAFDHRAAVAAAIRGTTCERAGAAAQAVLDAVHAHDIAYDRQTRHGQTTILPFS